MQRTLPVSSHNRRGSLRAVYGVDARVRLRVAVGVMAAVWVTLRSKKKASRMRVFVTHLSQLEAQPLQARLSAIPKVLCVPTRRQLAR